MTEQERWLPIPGWEGLYEISDMGRVRSLDRIAANGRFWKGRIRALTISNGYLAVSLWRGGSGEMRLVSGLVATVFCGPKPPGKEVRHLNGDAWDNRAENLAWGTSSENKLDQVRHGTHHEANVTHCPQGHPYEGANLYVRPSDGRRRCRTCINSRARAKWVPRRATETRAT